MPAHRKNKKSKKEIQVSRSFGTPITKLEDLTQALATHAIKASEKNEKSEFTII